MILQKINSTLLSLVELLPQNLICLLLQKPLPHIFLLPAADLSIWPLRPEALREPRFGNAIEVPLGNMSCENEPRPPAVQ